jgi:competence protein ComEA
MEYNYSKTDSAFNAINFTEDSDSLKVDRKVDFKTKELPKGKININKASIDDLAKLPGIGLKTAGNILDFRKKIRYFKSIDQLKDVKGISNGKFGKVKNYIIAE